MLYAFQYSLAITKVCGKEGEAHDGLLNAHDSLVTQLLR
jgi:hypothetical protein